MADTETLQALLSEEQEGWSDIEDLEGRAAADSCDVATLFKEHPQDLLRYLQTKGIARLGTFWAPDRTVFPAFENDSLLTLGSSVQQIDYEREWTRVLDAAARKQGRSDKTGDNAAVAVEAFVVTVRGAADADKDGLLQPLLKRVQSGRYTHAIFALPAVQAVIDYKWSTFARRLMLWELFFFLLWLVSFNVFTIAFQDEDLSMSLPELLHTQRGVVTVVSELLALLGMLPFLLLEAGTVVAYGWGWLDTWNVLDFCTYAVQFTITVMHLGRLGLGGDVLSVLPALQLVLLVFRLQYFLQAFRPTRFAFLDTIRAVVRDMKWMFMFMLLVMWGFGSAFHILFRRDQAATKDYDTILHSFATMFEHQSGSLELKTMYGSQSPIAATTMALAYSLVMGMVLANLLVGIVVNSLEKATEDADTKMLLSQARIIDELEATMPRWLERRNPHWYPQYVHALRIDTDKLDEVQLDSLWSRTASKARREPPAAASATTLAPAASIVTGQPGNGAAEGGAASAGVEQELRAALAGMREQLDQIEARLLKALSQQQQ